MSMEMFEVFLFVYVGMKIAEIAVIKIELDKLKSVVKNINLRLSNIERQVSL